MTALVLDNQVQRKQVLAFRRIRRIYFQAKRPKYYFRFFKQRKFLCEKFWFCGFSTKIWNKKSKDFALEKLAWSCLGFWNKIFLVFIN